MYKGNTQYIADVISTTDYYAFGSALPGRSFNSSEYEYGFQGQEKDDEIADVEGAYVNYKYRMHNTRLGRFFAVDPLTTSYPHNSPYAFSENRVIDGTELEGLEVVLIHGTTQSNSDTYDDNTVKQFERIAGNTYTDKSFSWGDQSALLNSRNEGRKTSAEALANHVVKVRNEMIANETIKKGEPITLVGYSHGGNVAIQAADLIYEKTGVKVNIITVATPAYNDASSEDPATKESIAKHIHLFSKADGVDALAGGNETYTNGYTVNYEISTDYIADEGTIDTHSNIGNKSTNSGLSNFLINAVRFLSSTRKFEKTKVEQEPVATPAQTGPKF